MSESLTITAEIREDVGKGASRRLRREGKIPAVLYGGEKDTQALSLNHKDILHDAESESFYSSIMEIKVADGRTQDVVVRDMQRHPYKQHILHLDFMRVSATEVLRIAIPIHFINEEKSEAGKASGVVIQHQITEVEIAALPKDLPEFLEVDLSGLEPGGAVMLSDIKVPEGVEIVDLSQEDDVDMMVANAVHISEDQGTGAAAAAEAEALAEEEMEIGDTPLEDSDEEGEGEGEAEAGEEEESGD
ncbi:MAG: 50S ribosomal protein L25/general stress protein Ctc [Gammaproteobacteria bacterium]|nr:50S ribosomal protein L25/general stress protein Ctc [Gammaproteobacteria bacterium]